MSLPLFAILVVKTRVSHIEPWLKVQGQKKTGLGTKST